MLSSVRGQSPRTSRMAASSGGSGQEGDSSVTHFEVQMGARLAPARQSPAAAGVDCHFPLPQRGCAARSLPCAQAAGPMTSVPPCQLVS